MRSANVRSRRFWLGPLGITAIVVVGLLAALWVMDILNPALFGFGKKVSTAGKIPVPVSLARIPAYTRLTRDHLWDPNEHTISVLYLTKQQVGPEMITNINQIIGRVLDHDKPPNFVFTNADFFPPGTRPGLVAGIPTGKRAVRVDASKVAGLVGLNPGDRFDLVATIPIDVSKGGTAQALKVGGVYGQQLALQNQLTNWQKQATVRVLVQNGVVVEPMRNRQVPVSMNTLTQGMVTREKTVQEIVIAVGPTEVARLTEALAVNAEVSCVPRSGRPDDPEDSYTPDLQPWSPFTSLLANTATPEPGQEIRTNAGGAAGSLTAIESINGTKREMVAAPRQR